MPFGSLVLARIENLLAAGRLLSCDAITHTFMREVPNCWAMGQAAGVAAALSISAGVRVRDVDIAALQRELAKQGVPLHGKGAKRVAPVGAETEVQEFTSAWKQKHASGPTPEA